MNAKQVKRAIGIVQAALAELRDLRWHRTGRHTASQLREELEAFNRGIAAGNTMLLRQKLEWFHHDSIRRELGNIQTVLRQLYPFLTDASVQQQIRETGYEPGKVMHHFAHSLEWVEKLRSVVDAHESLVKQALAGSPVEHSTMTKLEDRILRLNDWEERVARLCEGAVAEVTYHPSYASLEAQEARDPSLCQRIIGAFMTRIALPIAAAAAGMFIGTSAYAQDVAKNEPRQQEVVKSIDDQILVLEAKQNKSPEETLALAQLYVKADKPAKADEILRAYLKENPNDIRGLVQKRDIDGKKGLARHPDDELNKIIDSWDKETYRQLVKDNKRKEIVQGIEPLLNKLLTYDLSGLSQERKLTLSAMMSVLGTSYNSINMKDQALAACYLAVELVEASPTALGTIGNILLERNEYKKAQEIYTKIVKVDPKKHNGYAGLGYSFAGIGNYTEAMVNFEKASELSPNKELREKYLKAIEVCKEKSSK
jgi:tetratricopeptide (TPR) repeat protein